MTLTKAKYLCQDWTTRREREEVPFMGARPVVIKVLVDPQVVRIAAEVVKLVDLLLQ